MKFDDFEGVVSVERLSRYLGACHGDKVYAVQLYRLNIRVSLEMFAAVGAFEVALRNSIDRVMREVYGADWLRDAVLPGGIFDIPQCRDHAKIIRRAYDKLQRGRQYSHANLLSKMEFGIWKYMFSGPQFRASGRILLKVFPRKPISTRDCQYNNTFVFNELDHVNSLRNRIAHHEPICFRSGSTVMTTWYVEFIYNKIITLFKWLDVNSEEYLYELEWVVKVCNALKRIEDKYPLSESE